MCMVSSGVSFQLALIGNKLARNTALLQHTGRQCLTGLHTAYTNALQILAVTEPYFP